MASLCEKVVASKRPLTVSMWRVTSANNKPFPLLYFKPVLIGAQMSFFSFTFIVLQFKLIYISKVMHRTCLEAKLKSNSEMGYYKRIKEVQTPLIRSRTEQK